MNTEFYQSTSDLPEPEIHLINIQGDEKFWYGYQKNFGEFASFNKNNLLMTFWDFMQAYGYFQEFCFLNNIDDLSLIDPSKKLKLMGLPL